jgi:hypothetical protein
MRSGDFEAAWRISDEVERRSSVEQRGSLPMEYESPCNDESFADRRVFIRCNHGLGDTIQFVRYLPLVGRAARRVILQTQAQLTDLCATVGGADEIVTEYDDVTPERYDVEFEVMELPHVFRTTLESIPTEVPYVRVQPRRITAGDSMSVGLVWEAGDWDPRRSIPWRLLTVLSRVGGITWHILQLRQSGRSALVDFGVDASSHSVADAARTMAGLDLMISVDSMPAHLAGAIGVPVWTLLHAESDWRWLRGRNDSPWYPTMRLFRQQRPGDWRPVIEQVAEELENFVCDRLTIGNPRSTTDALQH